MIPKLKVLFVNKYFYRKGGADVSFFRHAEILQRHGHKTLFFSMEHEKNYDSEYRKYFVSNVDYEKAGVKNSVKASLRLLYSLEAKRKIEALINDERPDIVHFSNIYHQISPSIIHTIKKHRIPVVMTLHDYKLVCASYLLYNNAQICEACKGGRHFQCVLKKCVKNSRAKSFLNACEMYLHHNLLRIYDLNNAFISPSRFLQKKAKEMGFKGDIVYLPNAVDVQSYKPAYGRRENSIIYFGRLSREKGLFTLLEAMKGLDGVALKIAGDGPLMEGLRSRADSLNLSGVTFLGYRSGEDLTNEISKAIAIVLPSEWYENNPRSILEGFALGKPAIGARIGGIPELVVDGQTGLTFEAGNPDDLRAKIIRLRDHPQEAEQMGKNARRFVEDEFGDERYYKRLMEIYGSAKQQI